MSYEDIKGRTPRRNPKEELFRKVNEGIKHHDVIRKAQQNIAEYYSKDDFLDRIRRPPEWSKKERAFNKAVLETTGLNIPIALIAKVRGDEETAQAYAPVPQLGRIKLDNGKFVVEATSALRNSQTGQGLVRDSWHGADSPFDTPDSLVAKRLLDERREGMTPQTREQALGEKVHYSTPNKSYASRFGRFLRNEEVKFAKPLILGSKEGQPGMSREAAEKIVEQAFLRNDMRKGFSAQNAGEYLAQYKHRAVDLLTKPIRPLGDDPRRVVWENRPEFQAYWRLRNVLPVDSDRDVKMILKHAGFDSIVTKNDFDSGWQVALMSPKAQTKLKGIEDQLQEQNEFLIKFPDRVKWKMQDRGLNPGETPVSDYFRRSDDALRRLYTEGNDPISPIYGPVPGSFAEAMNRQRYLVEYLKAGWRPEPVKKLSPEQERIELANELMRRLINRATDVGDFQSQEFNAILESPFVQNMLDQMVRRPHGR